MPWSTLKTFETRIALFDRVASLSSSSFLGLNVDVLQDLLTPIVPFIQIEKATVHKMKLNVHFYPPSSICHISSQPRLGPLHFIDEQADYRLDFSNWYRDEGTCKTTRISGSHAQEIWVRLFLSIAVFLTLLLMSYFRTKSKQTPKTGKLEYTQFDRVRDGLQLSIDHIHITWSLLGKYRHANPGDWRPHDFHIDLQNLQVYSVDENFNKVLFLSSFI